MKRIALCAGLNCVNPEAYNGWPGWLAGCVADARALAGVAARAGFDVAGLLNEAATVQALRDSISAVAEQVQSGDWFLLTFSGHGGRAGAWTWSGYQETLCCYDGQLADTGLRALLGKFSPGVNVVVVIDACHSGGMDRGGVPAAMVKAAPRFVLERVGNVAGPAEVRPVAANLLFMTACAAEEVAMDGPSNGAFTGALLEALRGNDQSWEQWFLATKSYMAKESPAQHPQWIEQGRLGMERIFA